MVFQKGNQEAVGNTSSGTPPKYDMLKEAQDLLVWSEKPDSTALYKFTFNKEYTVDNLPDFCKRKDGGEVFSLALKKAKERIANNREEKLSKGELHQAAWNRSASLYDKMLRQHEKDLVEEKIDYEVKSKEKTEAPPNDGSISSNHLLIAEKYQNMLKDKRIKELEDQVNGLKPKADNLIQSSDQTV